MDWMTMDLVGYPIHFHPPESKILDIHFTELDISIPGSSWCIQNNIFTDRGQGPPSLPDHVGFERLVFGGWLPDQRKLVYTKPALGSFRGQAS
jgi:hypothetical protein